VIYKFKSKATGDVIMLGPTGDHMLDVIGREPAAKGIIEPDAMPAAMAAIERAIVSEEAAYQQALADAKAKGEPAPRAEAIGIRQRAWPLVEMMKRAHKAGEPIVWGV
jgi:hypothetical protein